MRRVLKVPVLAAFAALIMAAQISAGLAAGQTIAITGGTVHTGTGDVIQGGTDPRRCPENQRVRKGGNPGVI